MTSISELTSTAKTQLNQTLVDGLNFLDNNETWTFTKYVRRVLPLDGYVFWVRADLLAADAPGVTSRPNTLKLKGYLHLTTDSLQEDEEIYDKNVVTFTAVEDMDPFNEVSNDELYLGEFFGLQFSFDMRHGLNKPADLYHYTGEAVYPRMLTQFVDDIDDLDLENVVVSSSLPIWLQLNKICPMFPAKLADQNFRPPYASVKCSSVSPIAGSYMLGSNSSQAQLVRENVTITLTGLRNNEALDFIRMVTEYTMRDDAQMGVMNTPFIQDERDSQNEFNILSMRKTITFQVNYYQEAIRNVSRRLIVEAIPKIYRSK